MTSREMASRETPSWGTVSRAPASSSGHDFGDAGGIRGVRAHAPELEAIGMRDERRAEPQGATHEPRGGARPRGGGAVQLGAAEGGPRATARARLAFRAPLRGL